MLMEEKYFSEIGDTDINNYGYNIVTDAYARTTDGVAKVEEIIDHMKALAAKTGNHAIGPDEVTYTNLMKAWWKEGKPGYMVNVEAMLAEMESRFQLKDIVTYGTVLKALAKCGDADAGARGEAILRRMAERGIPPNRICFNPVLNVYSNEGKWQEARSILDWMEQEASNGNRTARPQARDYTTCIWAYARAGFHAEELFNDAFHLFKTVADRYNDGDHTYQPIPTTVTSIIHVLTNCRVEGKAKFAKEILGMAETMGLVNDIINFNATLRACSTESGSAEQKLEALEFAVQTYQLMRQAVGTNSATFVVLFQCCELISDPDEKVASAEDFFRECCEAGKVNNAILACFREMAPGSDLHEELKHKYVDLLVQDSTPADGEHEHTE